MSRAIRFPSDAKPFQSVLLTALEKKCGAPNYETPTGGAIWFYDSSGNRESGTRKYVSLPNCHPITWYGQIRGFVSPECGRSVVTMARRTQEPASDLAVRLMDAPAYFDAAKKQSGQAQQAQELQRQNELDKSKGVAAPKF